jgi:hypothetical protein
MSINNSIQLNLLRTPVTMNVKMPYIFPHEWDGTSIRFKNPDGSWGEYVNLQGVQGIQGIQGAIGPAGTRDISTTLRAKSPLASKFEDKTWSGMTEFRGYYIWTDGVNIYYSDDTIQKVLDVATSTWSNKNWTGLSSFYGVDIWFNGTDIYYSEGTTQKVFDVETSTWSDKIWTGMSGFYGVEIWSDGTDIYYSSDAPLQQKKLIPEKKIR